MSDDGSPISSLPAATPASGGTFWLLLAFLSLGGALAEMALILGARFALQRFTLLNPQGVWLAPLANAACFVLPLGAVWLLTRRVAPARTLPVTAGVAVFLAVLEPLLVLLGRVHIAALLLLAAGVAVRAAQFAGNRPAPFLRLVRAATMALLAIAVTGGAAFNGVRFWRERAALAALPPSDEGAPNVILLVLDTVRALSLSSYGYDRPTSPFLASLAARGVRFDRAISTAPWSLPTHASLFTGRYPHEMSAGWSVPLDDTHATLAERLSKQGYATAGVAANLRYCSYEFGLSRGFAHYRDYDVSPSELLRTSATVRELTMRVTRTLGITVTPGRQWGERINERFLGWLDGQPKGRPFFAFLNYYDAHAPYAPAAPYDTLFLGRQPSRRDPSLTSLTARDVDDLRATYDASIRYLDERLRELHVALEQRGMLENTVIVVTSDHGEEFNEHGLMDHGNSLYFPSVHVPLIIVDPRSTAAGLVVSQPVTLRDVPRTIQDLVGTPASLALPGHSLAPHWRSPDAAIAERSPLIAEVDFARNLPGSFAVSKGDMRSLVVDGVRYIRRGDGFEELFDIRRDPWERRELSASGDKTAARTKEVLRARSAALTDKTALIP